MNPFVRIIFAAAFLLCERGTGTASAAGVSGTFRINGDPAADAVVFLTHAGTEEDRPDPLHRTIRQENLVFHPSLTVVTVGSTVDFENLDHEMHNVHSRAAGNRFDVGAHLPGTVKSVVLKKPGPVPLSCSIHDGMNGMIYVVPVSDFAVTDSEGRFEITGIGAGDYRLEAWYPRLSPEEANAGGRSIRVEREWLDVAMDFSARAPEGSDLSALAGIEARDWDRLVEQIGRSLEKALDLWKRGKRSSAMRTVMTAHSRLFTESGFADLVKEKSGSERAAGHDRRFNAILKGIQSAKPGKGGEKAIKRGIKTLMEALREDSDQLRAEP